MYVSVVSLLCVATFVVFVLPKLFADEYNTVYLVFSEGNTSITTDPQNLFDTHVSKKTAVVAQFKNKSENECAVILDSQSVHQSFTLDPGLEYGLFLPKGEDVTTSFCGNEKTFRVN